jgi:Tol biopolymer transport system component
MASDGSNQKKHTKPKDHDYGDQDPAWSPDGTKIAFQRFHLGNTAFLSNRDIYLVNAKRPEGRRNRATNLTNNTVDDLKPSFSPDGQKIAFARDLDVSSGSLEIYVMDTVRATNDAINLTNASGQDLAPTFSPDGQKIAFASGRDGNGEIYMMDADGDNQINISNNLAHDFNPDWQPVVK